MEWCEDCGNRPATVEVFLGGPGPEPDFGYFCAICNERRWRAALEPSFLSQLIARVFGLAKPQPNKVAR